MNMDTKRGQGSAIHGGLDTGPGQDDGWLEQVVRDAREGHRLAFERNPDAVHVNRFHDGLYVNVNASFCKLIGYDREEVLGRTSLDLCIWAHPADRERFQEKLAASGWVDGFEVLLRRKDGSTQLGEMSSRLIDLCGERCILSVTRDTGRLRRMERRLRSAEQRFRDIFDNAPIGVIQAMLDGRLLDINRAGARIFGHASPEDALAHGGEIMAMLFGAGLAGLRETLLTQGSVSGLDLRLVRPDGSEAWCELSARLVRDSECSGICFDGFITDVSERRRAEIERSAADRNYRLLVDNALEAIAVIQDKRVCFANPRFSELSGYTREELAGLPIFSLIHPADKGKVLKHHRKRLKGDRHMPATYDLRGLGKSGQVAWLLVNAERIEWNGRPAVLAFFSDITEQKRTEEALRKSQMLYQAIVEDQTELVCRFSPDTRLTFINDAFARFFGRAKEELLDARFLDLVPEEDRDDLAAYLEGFSLERPSNCLEHRVLSSRGRTTWLQRCDRALHDDSGRLTEFQCVGRDTTDRRLYEEQIVRSLQEKEILLREIHHRVKNNLQIISSLLHLQAATDERGANRDLFIESQNRIMSMALVHEELYRSDDLASIDLLAYMRKLLDRLLSAMGDRRRIRGAVDGESVALTIDAAIPCGLIVNEMVTNSFKHAFGPAETGQISISVARHGADAVIEVADTGRGLPAGFDYRAARSLGLQLVIRLVRQLRGSITLQPGPGARFRATFPVR